MREIKVAGMSCGHCEASVKKALEENNASDVVVDLAKGIVQFEGTLEKEKISELLEDLGFTLESYAEELHHKILKPL